MNFSIQGAFFDYKDYNISIKIGEGGYSQIFLAERLHDQKQFALKSYNIFKELDAKDQMRLMSELAIYQKVNHPAIIKFYGVNFVSIEHPDILSPSILIDYFPNGTLGDVLKKERQSIADMSWNSTKKCINLIGIAHAANYLHEQGIIHGDLKLHNILLDENFYPKITDFGLSVAFPHPLTNEMEFSLDNSFGTPIYMAPEMIKNESIYGPSIDVYSYSICAYEIISGKLPYGSNASNFQLMNSVLKGERPLITDDFTEPMIKLISRCWREDPSERPSFKEIYEQLSTNFKYYFFDDLDEDEILDYIDYLNQH